MNRRISLLFVAVVAIFSLAIGASGQAPKDPMEKFARLPDVPIALETPVGMPLVIRQAKVKTLTRTEYQQSVGPPSKWMDVDNYSSYPTVVVTNNSDQRITGFAIMLINKRETIAHYIRPFAISIEPHSDFTIAPRHWRPGGTMRQRTADGQMIDVVTIDENDPSRLWLPGTPADLTLELGLVQFEDRTVYKVKPDKTVEIISPR